MKTSILTAVITSAVLCAQGAYADETHHPDKKEAPAKSAPTKDTKATVRKEMPSPQMQENLMKMHDLMHKIHDTKDPKEREKLMQEHMQMMQEHMKMMHGMMDSQGGGMMGHGMMGGDGKDGMKGAPAGK
ncbi:MAG: hypothetical protein HZA59_08390 [Hydrogenophilales bacterium]|nr:hypothetical protein [Hydrogenophilales bacterium]